MTQIVRFAIAARTLWTSFAQTNLVRPCDPLGAEHRRNRATFMVMGRIRMSGGVVRAVSDGGPYLIYATISYGNEWQLGGAAHSILPFPDA